MPVDPLTIIYFRFLFDRLSELLMVFNTSLTQAINFLTRPLIPIYAPAMINDLQHILRSTLNATYPPSRTMHFTLSFSATNHPSRPVYAACIATGILSSDCIRLLSQSRAFDLLWSPTLSLSAM